MGLEIGFAFSTRQAHGPCPTPAPPHRPFISLEDYSWHPEATRRELEVLVAHEGEALAVGGPRGDVDGALAAE